MTSLAKLVFYAPGGPHRSRRDKYRGVAHSSLTVPSQVNHTKMLSRAVVFFFAFLSLFVTSQIYAAPTREIASRQLGTIGCELARVGVSVGLSTLQTILTTVEGQVTDNAALTTVIQTVLDAVSTAEDAVNALGSTTSASDALALVQTNIATVETALGELTNSTSSDIGANIEKALEQIAATALADALAACQ